MKPNPSQRGAIARRIAGADAVEFKATIPAKQIQGALAYYGLEASNDEERYIYFFDTPDLDLFRNGIIARARRIIGDEHDSTVKFRPLNPELVLQRWRKYSGFKIEADASLNGIVVSGSLTMPVEKGLIRKVAAGKEGIARLFTEEQQLFLLSLAEKKLDYSRALTLGPVRAWRWKFSDPGLPWPLTAELWRRADGATLLELSIKVPAPQAAAAGAGFVAFLAEMGAERDEGQQAKTRWALDYSAATLQSRRPSTATKSPPGVRRTLPKPKPRNRIRPQKARPTPSASQEPSASSTPGAN